MSQKAANYQHFTNTRLTGVLHSAWRTVSQWYYVLFWCLKSLWRYSAVHGFWPVVFSNGRLKSESLMQRHVWSRPLRLRCTVVLFTLKFTPRPFLTPIGPSASSAEFSTGQKRSNVLYHVSSPKQFPTLRRIVVLCQGSSLHVLVQTVEVLGLLGPAHADGSIVWNADDVTDRHSTVFLKALILGSTAVRIWCYLLFIRPKHFA
jgi:hypothetical protein